MKPTQSTNVCLAALIEDAGFGSLERFAQAVNVRGGQMHGIKLAYDHISVKRWLSGGACQNPDVVAAVLSDAWGIPIPVEVIWPELRGGSRPAPAHLQPWVAAHTLKNLSVFLRSDMLSRREILTDAVGLATGSTFVEPIARWLRAPASGPGAPDPARPVRIGLAEVESIERSTRYFAAADAEFGGGMAREAAVGRLKYAVDLARHASYSEAVGRRLLVAIADLAAHVGWMCHDTGMEGPAQKYLVYGLQAARESNHERAPFLVIANLCNLALQDFLVADRPETGLRLIDLAFDQLPRDGRRLNKLRSHMWSRRAFGLAKMGDATPEALGAVGLSFDLYSRIGDEDNDPAITTYFPYAGEAELAHHAACCYRLLAGENRALAAEAERHAQYAAQHRPDGFTRSRVFDQIELARARFAQEEPDQACADAATALDLAGKVNTSKRVTARLHQILEDAEPYRDRASVRDLRERLAGR